MIESKHPHLTVAALTHAGESGKNNEDRYSVTSYRLEDDKSPVLLAIVADGIGGHQAGEIASQLAVDTIVRLLGASSGKRPLSQLRSAIVAASIAIARAAKDADERKGMGSTAAAAMIIGPRLFTAHVGDSRIYLMRDGAMRPITIDHTWVQEAIEHGIITPDEARNHPNAHVLRRYLGGPNKPEVDVRLKLSSKESDARSKSNQGFHLQRGDRLLLCTDGLTDLVEDKELRNILRRHPPKEAVRKLVDLARGRGGHDNITVVVLEVPGKGRVGQRRGCLMTAVIAFIVLVGTLGLLALGLAASWWFGFWPWSPSNTPTPSAIPTETSTAPAPFEWPTLTETAKETPLMAYPPTPGFASTPTPSSTPVPLPTLTLSRPSSQP